MVHAGTGSEEFRRHLSSLLFQVVRKQEVSLPEERRIVSSSKRHMMNVLLTVQTSIPAVMQLDAQATMQQLPPAHSSAVHSSSLIFVQEIVFFAGKQARWSRESPTDGLCIFFFLLLLCLFHSESTI